LNGKSIALFSLVAALVSLGLFVNSLFFFAAMVSLCGGHTLLGHNHGKGHEATSDEDGKKTKLECH
jgi:hypothetical protein